MTFDELQENWQKYRIDIDVYLEKEKRRITGRMVLKERFFICFKFKDIDGKDAFKFDPGGHNPKCYTYRCDAENNCYLRFPGGEWLKIGKFVKIE